MPFAALRPCLTPGCPELVARGRCSKCEPSAQAADRARRGSARERGYTWRWEKARALFLAKNPLCRPCSLKKPPQLTPATVVDHIVDHKGDQVLFWAEGNWQPSCQSCHDARVDAGDFGRAHPFPNIVRLDVSEADNVTTLRRPRWRRHRSARSLVTAWFDGLARSAGVSPKGWDRSEVASFHLEVRCSGAWAYCTPATRTVHYWFKHGLEQQQLVHMLAHELGHMVIDHPENFHSIAHAPRDEVKADLYGAVAAAAFVEARRALRPRAQPRRVRTRAG